jgi:hypothetical protein
VTAAAGYSGTPLATKLGLRAGHRVRLVAPPEGFLAALEPLPDAVRFTSRGSADVVVAFMTRRTELRRRWPGLIAAAGDHGAVWVAWPKRSSGVATDLTEDVLREDLLPSGWVDVKVCAIDATWSGLRFVRRRPERGR